MKTKAKNLTALLSTATLVACAGTEMQELPIHQRNIIDERNITGTYVLAHPASPLTKDHASRVLQQRSEEICPAGYAITSRELWETNANAGPDNEAMELVWQIRCNPQQKPTPLSF